VNHEQAKQILFLHRPGVAEEVDAGTAEALALLRSDEELRRWFENHRATQDSIREGFRKIAPPAALKEQIISDRPWYTKKASVRHVVAVAAMVIVLTGLGGWWFNREPGEDKSFAAYRTRMVSTAQRNYEMYVTDDLTSIRSYLQQHAAPGDFVLPANLDRAKRMGCLSVMWQRRSVAMICYKTGRPMAPGQSSDLWFFAVDRKGVPDAPETESPQFATLNGVTTASWTRNGKAYVLAIEGDEKLLRSYL
jgi:hypothetical protein